MKEEQVEKIFNLIEPFLPKQTVLDFREFMNQFKELKVLSEYNFTIIERQRNTIDQFSKKVRLYGEKLKTYEDVIEKLTEESEDWQLVLFEERKKQHKIVEETMSLQKKISELTELLQNEIDKNYHFAESVMKMADDNRTMIAANKKIIDENQLLCRKNEVLEQRHNDLIVEYEQIHEKIQIEYGRGFQTAHFHHTRRKR